MGGHGGYSNAGLEPAGGQGSIAAQSWGGDGRDGQARPQQGTYQQAPQNGYTPQAQPDPYQATAGAPPGAGYERPDTGYDRPAPQQQAYQPQPRQTYRAQPQPQQQEGYPDPTAGAAGPASTSGSGASQRHDEVGYAGVRGVSGNDNGSVVAVHRNLPAGSFVEVTSLETGKTIIVLVTGTMEGADHLADLSPAAARLLGSSSAQIPVRIRSVNPTGPDQAALLAGQPAGDRPDTPPVLLNALRKQLPAATVAAASPTHGRPAAAPARPAAGPRGAGFYVQVGAFSNQANANGLAQSLGGFVRPGGGLYRVQMGPYRSAGEAQAARAEAARRGYGDARVITQN
ncbi:SPOR domain-containing protein [Sphingomonas sp. LB-2]|uniref:SPOR domain-containing protein n=1 Tax=Sphingomonas caeni TaxID=2984949 RepID=UPI00222ED838|nr:SPOR domain-containing protein [Sphingomonas caeni]MCW3849149.1 SPOR domain-containing protein [Sphingomonas caeni]